MANTTNTGKMARAKAAKHFVAEAMGGLMFELGAVDIGGGLMAVPVTNDGITTYVTVTLTAKNDVSYEKDGEVVLAAFDPNAAVAKYEQDQAIKAAKKEALAAERAEAKAAKEAAAKAAKAE